ncbi:Chromatin assembly factor 1, subunit A [Linnemannia zychae]|nr:Chromatin assembly factor 1, subunit A [Linnemannia zychae]
MTKTLSSFFTKADTTKNNAVSAAKAVEPNVKTLKPPTEPTEPKESTEPTEPTESIEPTEAVTPIIPESPKPKKRATRSKKSKETTIENDTTTASTPNNSSPTSAAAVPKSPSKSRKGSTIKKEALTAVLIPGNKTTTAKKDSSSSSRPHSDLTTAVDPTPKPTSSKKGTKKDNPGASVKAAPSTSVPLATSDPVSSTNAKDVSKSSSKAAVTMPSTNTNTISTISTSTTGSGSNNMSKFNKIDTASMFKVRSGKASFTENKLKFSAHPSAIADLCKFHEYREKLQDAADLAQFQGVKLEADNVEITSIPPEHYGLIAKLVEENDGILSEVATIIKPTLCPPGFDAFEESTATGESDNMDVDLTTEDSNTVQPAVATGSCKRSATTISLAAIMEAIQSVAQRVNYGVPVVNLPGQAYVTPPNLSVFRWEVQDIDQYFPSDMKAAVIRRRTKRMEASAALTAWFLGLDAKQQEDLAPPPVHSVLTQDSLSGVEAGRLSIGGVEGMDVDIELVAGPNGTTRPGVILLEGQPVVEAVVDPAVLELKLKEAENKKKEAEAKEERRLEKERKMAEKQQEKDMKEAERQQKEEAKKRKAEEDKLKHEQRAMKFVGFFKSTTPATDKKDTTQAANGADCAATPLLGRFHPFYVKKNTVLAPINRFATAPRNDIIDGELGLGEIPESDKEVLTNDMDMMDVDTEPCPLMNVATTKTTISSLFSRVRGAYNNESSKPRAKKRLPQSARNMSVADVIQSGLLLQDDQDGEDMNSILTWKDIPALRMRLLQFAENYRPAYYGTWSKRSKNITGRRFLGKDTDLVDYDFDSEAEWEEDEEGEECKTDDDDEDDELGSEQEEEDDWLVPEGYLSDDEGLDAGDEGGSKSEMPQKKSKDLRRPTLAHMAPVIVGPVFEMTLGEVSTYPALEAYHVEFLGGEC